jgi:SsrA-binding protein
LVASCPPFPPCACARWNRCAKPPAHLPTYPPLTYSLLLPVAKAKSNKKKTADSQHEIERVVAVNRRARFEYEVLETLECGIMLVGSEVKSLRTGQLSLEESYGRVKEDEVWLLGCDIPEYVQANKFNHDPRRPRKLLMHRREVKKFAHRAYEQGLTLIPLRLYFREGRAKILMGICRGKKMHDKRETVKKREVQRDLQRAMRRR